MSTRVSCNVLPYERSPEHLPLASFANAGEACVAASKLESEGVACDVVEHAILRGISARGATVTVEAEQFARAAQLLAATPARRCLLVKPVEPGPDDTAGARTGPGFVGRLRQW